MASIKDIAKACGVSVATVSKALNGHSDISQATKEKVRQAADKLGYMPNSAARALKTNRTYNLGVLFVDDAQSGLTHEFFAAVLDSFKRHAEGRGYDITFINHNIGHGHSSYLEHCRYRGVDGVIAACVQFDDPEVVELAYSNLPLVTVDHVFNNRAAVLSDNMEGIRRLVDELAALGHERIAFIHGEKHSAVTQKRLVGFYRACEAHGITVPDEYVIHGSYWGGTWICAATGTDNVATIKDVMYSLTCDSDIMTKITEDTQDYTNSKSAMDAIAADPNFGSDFLGGQNHIALFAEVAPTIDMSNAGPYDQGCNETFQSCFKDYFDGTVDLETAKSNFEDQIKVKYPELTSVEWPA